MSVRICRIGSCIRPARPQSTLCIAHKGSAERTASGRAGIHVRRHTPAWLRVVTSVKRDDKGCWIWQRPLDDNGYPRLIIKGHSDGLAHRVAYTAFVGPIPDGLTLDHLCRVPACVNPEHLEPVTLIENIRRAPHYNSLKTHCKRGHEYTPENTRVERDGGRRCLECARSRRAVAA